MGNKYCSTATNYYSRE